jgi:alanyl-tRNA synthetase
MTEQPSGPVWRVVDSTRVNYAESTTSGTSRILAVGRSGLIVAETPFHPGSPDQPGDTGTVRVGGRTVSVVDCVVGAVHAHTRRLLVGADIPVPVGAAGWYWVVVHLLAGDLPAVPGSVVSLRVDAARRRELSVAHTAHHLSGLALNASLASLWRRGMPPDTLGNPDFDTIAWSSTSVTATGFTDSYRIRTWSSRDGGLDPDGLDSLAHVLGRAVSDRIRRWLGRRSSIRFGAAGPHLTDLRWWDCDLPQGTARVTCGGVHASDLRMVPGVHVTASLSADRTELILSGAIGGRQRQGFDLRASRQHFGPNPSRPGARTRIGPSHAAGHLHSGLRAIRH